jgi:Domain of unknown function (DUF4296)
MLNKIFLVIIVLIISCKPKFDKKPENLVSKDKMVNIMADVHRLEGFVNNLSVQSSDTSQFIYRKMEAKIFKKYGVDTTAYLNSYKYYLINTEEFSEMYKSVVKIIKEKNKVDSLAVSKLKKPKIDSLALVKLKKVKLDSAKNIKNEKLKLSKLFLQKNKLDSLKAKNGRRKKKMRLGKR